MVGPHASCSACIRYPTGPAANYRRLARFDETGLIWLLRGGPVVALTETTAAIQGATAVLNYRKFNKPALGPVGDSLDDFDGSKMKFRALDHLPLFADDAAIGAALLGSQRAGEWTQLAALLEVRGLPEIDALMGGRYVPAIKAFFDRDYGLAGAQVPSRTGWHRGSRSMEEAQAPGLRWRVTKGGKTPIRRATKAAVKAGYPVRNPPTSRRSPTMSVCCGSAVSGYKRK